MKNREFLTRKLLSLPSDRPVSAQELSVLGIHAYSRNYYVKTGWLKSLQSGTYTLPNAKIQRNASIEFLQTSIKGLHLGSRSALAEYGFIHNLPISETIVLFADVNKTTLPKWFTEKFNAVLTGRSPFAKDFDHGIENFRETNLQISSPPRAVFEMLDLVNILYGVEETKNTLDLIQDLRRDDLSELISACKRTKVLRLLGHWSKELNLPYADFVCEQIRRVDNNKTYKLYLNSKETITLPPL